MCRKLFLVLGVGLLLGFGLPLSGGADDTGLERPRFALTTLDGPGNVGQYTSVTIGADGLGLISYHDVSNRNLKVAHCSNRACTSATLTTLDSTGEVGQFTSVTIGADRLGLISYYDADQQPQPQGGALLQPGLHLRHPHHPGRHRRCRSVHLRDHRGRRLGPHQLPRRHQRQPQGGPLLQPGLHRRHPHHTWTAPARSVRTPP